MERYYRRHRMPLARFGGMIMVDLPGIADAVRFARLAAVSACRG
jgi:hypothetical protein